MLTLNLQEHDDADDVSDKGEHQLSFKDLSPSKSIMFQRVLRQTVLSAKNKNFERAEELRECLFKINPKAIKEIFKTGRIIEQEKKRASRANKQLLSNKQTCKISENVHDLCEANDVDQHGKPDGVIKVEFTGFWFDLYRKLSSREATGFTTILKMKEYNEATVLIRNQQKNSKLYFMNHGNATVTQFNQGDAFSTKQLAWGDVVGIKSFFDHCLSSIAFLVNPGTRVEYIEKTDFDNLVNECPEFHAKFFEFCMSNGPV